MKKLLLFIMRMQTAYMESDIFPLVKYVINRSGLRSILIFLFYDPKFFGRKIRLLPVIFPRYTGRMGNQITEFSFCLLLALRSGLPIMIPPRMKILGLKDRGVYFCRPGFQTYCRISDIIGGNDTILKFPHHVLFHQSHLNLLRKIFFPGCMPGASSTYDVVIHLRLGDIVNLDRPIWKKILSLDYLTSCLSGIHGKEKKPLNLLFVTELQTEAETAYFRSEYYSGLRQLPYVDKIDLQSGTAEEDFRTLMKFRYLFMSVSSFSYWAALLSVNAQEVHVPMIGFTDWEINARLWPDTVMKKIILHDI